MYVTKKNIKTDNGKNASISGNRYIGRSLMEGAIQIKSIIIIKNKVKTLALPVQIVDLKNTHRVLDLERERDLEWWDPSFDGAGERLGERLADLADPLGLGLLEVERDS